MASSDSKETATRRRVLVIDDDAIVLRMVGEFLRVLPVDVETAASGPEGLLKLRRFHPHLVLLDVEMPGVDGFDVCARIRQVAAGIPRHLLRGRGALDEGAGTGPDEEATKVIFLTARNTAEDVIRAHEVGADGFIRKPFAVEELRRRVDAALGLGIFDGKDEGREQV